MTKGFFTNTKTDQIANIDRLKHKLPKCGLCGLHKTCKNPKMPVSGKGKLGILIIAEAPGEMEDRLNTQLIGDAGQHLRKHLKSIGVSLDKDCWKTNAIICRPPRNKTPDDKQIRYCRPNLLRTISELNPTTVILLGNTAVRSLIGLYWKENTDELTKWVGWRIPSIDLNMWICPTYHPSYLIRKRDKVLDDIFNNHLQDAVKTSGNRPWKEKPNYEAEIKLLMVEDEINSYLKKYNTNMGTIAFDYETNMLKSDNSSSEIVSASICWKGEETIAFPMLPKVKEPFSAILHNKSIGKIAANMKFEDRWTRRHFGKPVANWVWDTMLASHILNNKKGINGLKFQSFVRMGVSTYNDYIEPYLKTRKGEGSNHPNRIKEADLKQLLFYNGMDSLLEYKLALLQMRDFGLPFGDVK